MLPAGSSANAGCAESWSVPLMRWNIVLLASHRAQQVIGLGMQSRHFRDVVAPVYVSLLFPEGSISSEMEVLTGDSSLTMIYIFRFRPIRYLSTSPQPFFV